MRRSMARASSRGKQPGRHAAAPPARRTRPFGRRRWLVAAAAAAAFSGMVSPASQTQALDTAGEDSSADERRVPTLPELAAGAPEGAVRLAGAPVEDPDPARRCDDRQPSARSSADRAGAF